MPICVPKATGLPLTTLDQMRQILRLIISDIAIIRLLLGLSKQDVGGRPLRHSNNLTSVAVGMFPDSSCRFQDGTEQARLHPQMPQSVQDYRLYTVAAIVMPCFSRSGAAAARSALMPTIRPQQLPLEPSLRRLPARFRLGQSLRSAPGSAATVPASDSVQMAGSASPYTVARVIESEDDNCGSPGYPVGEVVTNGGDRFRAVYGAVPVRVVAFRCPAEEQPKLGEVIVGYVPQTVRYAPGELVACEAQHR